MIIDRFHVGVRYPVGNAAGVEGGIMREDRALVSRKRLTGGGCRLAGGHRK
jgi:hypothetical protein